MINVNELIKNAMKSKNQVELRAYKNLKAEIQLVLTAKNAKPYDEVAEIGIIKKYCDKLSQSIEQFQKAHRQDLAFEYMSEREVLRKLLPEPVNERKLYGFLEKLCFEKGFVHSYLDNGAPCPMEGYELQIPKKEMGAIIKAIKSQFPQADGRIISDIVKKYVV